MENEISNEKVCKNISNGLSKVENWKITMNKYRKNDIFTDVTLCNNIRAHKCFLATESKYFEKLFTNPYNKDKSKLFKLINLLL